MKRIATLIAGSAGSLPFTGLDLVLLLGGAIALIAAGLVARFLTRRGD